LPKSGKRVCNFNDRGHKHIESAPVVGDEDKGDNKEEEDEEEEQQEKQGQGPANINIKKTEKVDLCSFKVNDKNDQNAKTFSSFPKERSQSSTQKDPFLKRRIKRRRFSSPASSNEETEIQDESTFSSCTPFKPYNISTTQSASSQAILAEDASKDDKMEFVNERQKRPSTSRTTVIYERQSWEGEVVGERDVRQGRGRPRKQYLVQWKQSWVDGGRLTAPELLQNWKEKKALRCRF
jgi:hypothetical protein